ncbi:MAG: hypothetical protein PCFJNLEI_03560 [Verrucomicrobiae bacterium]|nr:hypothetical protein [Verrucomicrobiae bacterium]
MIQPLNISAKVSRAAPTVAEKRAAAAAKAADDRAAEARKRQREADAEADKLRARLHTVIAEIGQEKEWQNKIRHTCTRSVEYNGEIGEIEIAAVLDEALGNAPDALAMQKAESLRERRKAMIADVKKFVKQLHAVQAKIPALEAERHELLRQLGVY